MSNSFANSDRTFFYKASSPTKTDTAYEAEEIDVDSIDFPSKDLWAVAKTMEEENLSDLVGESLNDMIVVRPIADGRFELVIGGGLLALALRMKWRRIPAIVKPMTDRVADIARLIENIDRKDLNPLEVSKLLRKLNSPISDGGHGLTQSEIGNIIGKGHAWVSQQILLLGERPTKMSPWRNAFREVINSPLEDLFWNHFGPARHTRGSEGTRTQYALTIKRFDEFCQAELGRHFAIEEITDSMVDRFKGWRTCSAATVNKDLRGLRALVNFAIRRKLRSTPIDWIFEQEFVDGPEAWSFDEVARILKSCRQERGTICGVRADRWWVAQQLVILNTSARITAVMKARSDKLDWNAGTLTLPARDQKHRHGQTDRLADIVLAAVKAIYNPKRELLFEWPFDKNGPQWQALTNAYRKILARAGLPTGRKCLFHRLRKTNATYIVAASDMEAARAQLGHSSISVTSRYVDTSKIERNTAANLLPWESLAAAEALEQAG